VWALLESIVGRAGLVRDLLLHWPFECDRVRVIFPSPHPHHVILRKPVAKCVREPADLAAVMRIMLKQVRHHIHAAVWHALDP
jgi:hypothetical protein